MTRRTIHKFLLREGIPNRLIFNIGAVVLSVHNQHEKAALWVLQPLDEEETETRVFHLIKTGDLFPNDPGIYIGTVLLNGGSYVLHVFEEKNTKKITS